MRGYSARHDEPTFTVFRFAWVVESVSSTAKPSVDTWIIVGLMSAAAWGLSCVIDVCFVGEGIYRRPVDGPLIAGIFYIVPLIVFGLPTATIGPTSSGINPGVVGVASLSGIAYLLHIYFYFKALFALNDASKRPHFAIIRMDPRS